MKKNSLAVTGLSLSQAQSISNLCNQRAREIEVLLVGTNNYSKKVSVIQGSKSTEHETVVGVPILDNVVELLKEKAKLHACQGFLMENIKAKDTMLKTARAAMPDISEVKIPVRPQTIHSDKILPNVDEIFGWEQLTVAEYNEYIDATAFAAHIGQYIHNGGTLDKLRRELPNVKAVEWMNIRDGEKSPVTVTKHHTSEQLLKVHEKLATLHRSYEQRVNYFNAKVKNITTNENARISKVNADIANETRTLNNLNQKEYQTLYVAYEGEITEINAKFEEYRQKEIEKIAKLRINVDARFQETINEFVEKMETK